MRLLDWLLGRGRNPLEAPGASTQPRSRVTTTPHLRTPERHGGDAQPDARDAEPDELMRQQAQSLGVSVESLATMLEQRELFVAKVQADPRAWGFDLAAAGAPRRDAAEEYRRATRLTGVLGESFLSGYEPLMAAAPDPLTMPDGTPLPRHLEATVRLDAEAARDIADHIRSTIQARLGRPLDADAFAHAVREAAWDHELDAAQVTPYVLRAVEELL